MKIPRARQLGRYAAFAALWAVLAAMFFAARRGAADYRATQCVESVNISVDGGDAATFLSEDTVREWVLSSDCNPLGRTLAEVDIAALESAIGSDDAVAEANVFVTSGGSVEIDVRQRRPLMRLMIDGYDRYVSNDGYLFAAPPRSTIYVPVVTGDYRPLFDGSYSGYAHAVVRDSISRLDERIAALERDKMPLYRALQQNSRAMKKLSSERASKGWFTSEEEYALRCEQLELYKAQRREKLTAEAKSVQSSIDDLTRDQESVAKRQKKLEKIEKDFSKLINFVDIVQHDDFWRSEIVQIVAHGGGERELELELVPRSGRYTILFGRADDVERKLSDLDAFYRNVLTNVGWDKYGTVDVKYRGQVVCRQ